MKASDVSPVHGASVRLLRAKGTLAGKMLAALRRQRHAPVAAVTSQRLARRDGPPPAPGPRRHVRGVYVVLCGPGELAPLTDVVASIRAFEGEDVGIVVVEDATADVRWPAVQAHCPGAVVVRHRWPTGGPPHLSPLLALGIRAALARFDFDVLCKLDTDALVTGPGLTALAAERFGAEPGVGMLGTIDMRADGVPEDYSYDRWVLEHEQRWSRAVRARTRRARARGYDWRKVHGGVMMVSRAALDAVAAAGDLDVQPPWWSQVGDELWLTLAVRAAGFGLASWGAPGEPTASASKFMPVDLEAAEAGQVLAVHSVRRGPRGESESVIRRTLQRAREP